MLFKRLNRDGAENAYVSVENVQGATITTGRAVAYALGASNDGVKAVIADAAADYPGFIGVANSDIPANDYGLVQIAGFIPSIWISNVGTSITVNAGDPLVPAVGGFASAAPTYANSGFKYLHASNVPVAVSAGGYMSGLIKLV